MLAALLGWVGAAGVLLAFALNVRKYIPADSYPYILLNAAGSACLGFSAYLTGGFAFVFINIVWTSVALYSLYKKLKNR